METKHKITNQAGFTVLEILVVVGIVAMLLVVVLNVSITGFKYQFFVLEQNQAVEEAKIGVETMIKEIRESADGDDGSYPLVEALDNSFTFYSDMDVDAVTEKVQYYLENNEFKKRVTEPLLGPPITYQGGNETVEVLSHYVVNADKSIPVFKYYNTNYPSDLVNNPLATPASLQAITLVEVKLLINIEPVRSPKDVELSSFVQIRNLKENL